MSRLHPFDLLAQALGPAWFEDLRAAEPVGGGEPPERVWFAQQPPVEEVLARLASEAPEVSGALLEEYGTLLYALYRYWRAGRRSRELEREALERAFAQPAPVEPPVIPGGACYLAFPEHWFWARIRPEAPAEPLDGLFAMATAGGREILLVAVLGLRPERYGFSQIALSLPAADFPRAASLVRRPLFHPVLEGGEQAGLKSLVSEAELVHLAHLALLQAAR